MYTPSQSSPARSSRPVSQPSCSHPPVQPGIDPDFYNIQTKPPHRRQKPIYEIRLNRFHFFTPEHTQKINKRR